MSLVLVDSHVGSVDSNDVSKSVDDGEVLELVGIDNNTGVLSLLVEGWVNNLEGADESLAVDLIWESGVNHDSVEVAWLGGGEGGLGKLNVLVLKGKMFRMQWCNELTFDCCLAGDLDLFGVDFLADLGIVFLNRRLNLF